MWFDREAEVHMPGMVNMSIGLTFSDVVHRWFRQRDGVTELFQHFLYHALVARALHKEVMWIHDVRDVD